MLHHCQGCNAQYGAFAAGPLDADGVKEYTCAHCGDKQRSVEVPEHYLRELVMNSIKLASLVRLPGA